MYYIQYAHARICSIFRQAKEAGIAESAQPVFSLLTDESEIALIKKMGSYLDEISFAAKERAPHRIARYVHELASDFHSFYNRCRIMGVEEDLAQARLALVGAVANVIRHALGILGVSAPETM